MNAFDNQVGKTYLFNLSFAIHNCCVNSNCVLYCRKVWWGECLANIPLKLLICMTLVGKSQTICQICQIFYLPNFYTIQYCMIMNKAFEMGK